MGLYEKIWKVSVTTLSVGLSNILSVPWNWDILPVAFWTECNTPLNHRLCTLFVCVASLFLVNLIGLCTNRVRWCFIGLMLFRITEKGKASNDSSYTETWRRENNFTVNVKNCVEKIFAQSMSICYMIIRALYSVKNMTMVFNAMVSQYSNNLLYW